MFKKYFDDDVSFLGNFLKNKTAEETDIILSGVFSSFPMQSDTSNSEKKLECLNYEIPKIDTFFELTRSSRYGRSEPEL